MMHPPRTLVPRSALIGCLVLAGTFLAPPPGSAPDAVAEEAAREADPKAAAAELIAAFRSDSPEIRFKAIEAAQGVQHDSLTSPLVKLLADDERGIREAAIKALATRESTSARRKASSSLAARLPRLSKDPARQDELLLAVEALGRLGQGAAVKPLLDDIALDADIELVTARLMAVAEIPDKRAIEGLIGFLARGRRGGAGPQRNAARKALQYATGVNAARDNKQAGKDADRWRAWWRENEKHFDFEAVRAAREADAAEAAAKADRKRKQQEARKAKRDKQGGKKGQGGKPKQDAGADA